MPTTMPTDMRITTMAEADLLKLSQWLSPAFPVSSYAYSHGLEAEIAAGRVADAAGLRDWVAGVLAAGAGRNDTILMLAASRATQEADALADLARALAGARERLEETEAQGRALAETLAGLGIGDGVARPYPVALGLAARNLEVSERTLAVLFLQALAGALVSAAVRFRAVGAGRGAAGAGRPAPGDRGSGRRRLRRGAGRDRVGGLRGGSRRDRARGAGGEDLSHVSVPLARRCGEFRTRIRGGSAPAPSAPPRSCMCQDEEGERRPAVTLNQM